MREARDDAGLRASTDGARIAPPRKKLAVWGAAGHALVVADLVRLADSHDIVGFLDDSPERWGTTFDGATVLGGRSELDALLRAGVDSIILAFGDCSARLAVSELVRAKGFELATAVHPSATIARSAEIGSGTVVCAGAVVNPGSEIGENVILNTCASVDHDCRIRDGAHIGPGAHLGGHVTVGVGAWVGIGATVKDRVSIGDHAVIGAGAVVLDDIDAGVVAYGVPARAVRGATP